MTDVLVQVKDLNKKINGYHILKNINLSIGEGEIHGFIGPNGAGKTTTLRCMLGLIKADSGCSTILGKESYYLDKAIKSKIGVVLDEGGIYDNITALDNIMFFGRIYGLNKVSIMKSWDQYNKDFGLEGCLNKKVKNFSKGMKQNLKIFKEIMHNPKILFLDEPFSGLDPNARIFLRDTLNKLKNQGISIFLISHDLSEVEKISDKITMIEKGSIKFSGTLDEIQKKESKDIICTIRLKNMESYIEKAEKIAEFSIINIQGNLITVKLKNDKVDPIKLLYKNSLEFEEIYYNKFNLEKLFSEGM